MTANYYLYHIINFGLTCGAIKIVLLNCAFRMHCFF